MKEDYDNISFDQCNFCSSTNVKSVKQLLEHLENVCEAIEIDCEYMCGERITRLKWLDHLDICPNKSIMCINCGCEIKVEGHNCEELLKVKAAQQIKCA